MHNICFYLRLDQSCGRVYGRREIRGFDGERNEMVRDLSWGSGLGLLLVIEGLLFDNFVRLSMKDSGSEDSIRYFVD